MNGYAFVIDTDTFAVDFFRRMGAYLTGTVGEYGVGKLMIKDDILVNFDNIMYVETNEESCSSTWWESPCDGAPIKKNNSVAIFFKTLPNKSQVEFMKCRALGFNDDFNETYDEKLNMKILGFRLIEFVSTSKEIPLEDIIF